MEQASLVLKRLVEKAQPDGKWPICYCNEAMTIVMVWTKNADLPTQPEETATVKCQSGRCRQRLSIKLELTDEERKNFETTDLVPVNGKNR